MGFFDYIGDALDGYDDSDDFDDTADEIVDEFQTINRGDIVVYNADQHLFMRGERDSQQAGSDIKIGIAVDQSDDRHFTAVMLGHFLTKDPLVGSKAQIINKLKRCGESFKRACPEYRELKRMKLRVPSPEMLDMLLDPYIRESYEYFNGVERTDTMYDRLKTYAVLTQVGGQLKIWKYNRHDGGSGEINEFGRGFLNKDYGLYLPVMILNTYKSRKKK